MARKDETIAAPSHVVSNVEEIGRHIAETHDIETSVEDGPAPRSVAIEYFVEWYLQQHSGNFNVSKPADSDGNRNVTYTGSNSNE